jgi:hypothetical protein
MHLLLRETISYILFLSTNLVLENDRNFSFILFFKENIGPVLLVNTHLQKKMAKHLSYHCLFIYGVLVYFVDE